MQRTIDRTVTALGIGPEVTVRVESVPGAARKGEARVVFRALDAITHQMYESVRGGSDGQGGEVEMAELLVAVRCFVRTDNLDLGRYTQSGATSGKAVRKWLAGGSDEALALAHATVPVLLECSLPDQVETDALELAAYIMLDRQNDRNPYEVGSHREGCARDIWEDREAELLRPPEDGCDGCQSDRTLYRDVIKKTGSALWVDVARRAFWLSRQLEQFPQLAEVLSARNWTYVEIVRSELEKRRNYNDWEAGEEAKRAGKGK